MRTPRPSCAALLAAALLAATAAATGCAHTRVRRVWIPPRIDLQPYQGVGLISVSSVSRPDLAKLATQKLEQAIQAAQPGTPILELGPEQDVLQAVGHPKLDFAAVRAIGEHYRVGAVLVSSFEVGRVTPDVQISPSWHAFSAGANAQASLAAKLFETRAGASVWTRSVSSEAPVAHLAASRGAGLTGFGVTDPDEAYTTLLQRLVADATSDFWGHWESQRVRVR